MHRLLSRRGWLGFVGAALAALGRSRGARASETDSDVLATFEMDDLLAERKASGKPYLPFLEKETLRCGVYVLPQGGEDRQMPHRTDEVYYVVRGKAAVVVEGERRSVKPGSVVFVKREAEHRFVDIEEELELLVFFD